MLCCTSLDPIEFNNLTENNIPPVVKIHRTDRSGKQEITLDSSILGDLENENEHSCLKILKND